MLLSTGRHKGSRRPLPRREGSQPTARPRSPFHACHACLPIPPLSISSDDSRRTPGRLPHVTAQPGPSALGPGCPPAPVSIVQRRAVKARGGRRPNTGARRPARPAAPSATRRSKPPRSRASTLLRARERTHIRGRAQVVHHDREVPVDKVLEKVPRPAPLAPYAHPGPPPTSWPSRRLSLTHSVSPAAARAKPRPPRPH